MPVPENSPSITTSSQCSLGHVNLMVDSFVSAASINDLRAVIRDTLGSGNPGFANVFTSAARRHLRRTETLSNHYPGSYFECGSGQRPRRTEAFDNAVMRARTLYGAGLGFDSLILLAGIIKDTHHLRWSEEDDILETLAMVDTDVSQAIQSSKEELEAGRVPDLQMAHQTVENLRRAVNKSAALIDAWQGEFPFERTLATLQYWKL